ncbi:3'-5' exonuclease [Prevotella melaninogenica]|uniref:DNA 3'-5' helicase II n=1 Tax=Prevotella melaninogenica DNF00666 TaxID=1401073 RepID=A0A096CEE7_9BACT|nr:3'-5' exonuclease [Prevotella melaninogenica]KGF43634.1 hypothetical protein HMPREF0661_11790 [Prevotella melaninogenica DNF00666]
MNQIKERLKKDYNLAVSFFNEKDYESFFTHIRPSIELICKLIILDNVGDNEDGHDVLDGYQSISGGRDVDYVLKNESGRRPTGSALASVAQNALFYGHRELQGMYLDNEKKRTKKGIENYRGALTQLYSVASELGSHTGNSQLSLESQANFCAAFFEGYFDFLKTNRLLSDISTHFLSGLDAFSSDNYNQEEIEKVRSEYEKAIQERDQKQELIDKQNKQIAEQKAELEKLNASAKTEKDRADELSGQLGVKLSELEALRHRIAEQESEKSLANTPAQAALNAIDNEIEHDTDESITTATTLAQRLKGCNTNWHVEEESLDDDQLDLIDHTINSSMLVSGCAGSGKSVIAMHKAAQIANMGYSVILIALTKSLTSFMGVGYTSQSYQFYYHYQWKKKGMPAADYIIVDEIQDFELEEINEFISAAKKHYLFLGDSAQSIYTRFGKKTLSIEAISKLTGLKEMKLYNNYRLPKNVAQITQKYVGVNVMPYQEKVYMNNEPDFPHFIHYSSDEEQTEAIGKLIEQYKGKSIGILLYSNNLVLEISKALTKHGINLEFKCKTAADDRHGQGILHFTNTLPKVLTYHSAKGLQFDVVIIPKFEGAVTEEQRKSLYVAMTRTMHHLYVLYTTDKISAPLNTVLPNMYKKC